MTTSTLIMPSRTWMEDKQEKNASDDERENFMDFVKQIARSELRESESTKAQCLLQFRTWIQQNPDIQNCITDDNFLLRFLRVRKYSLPMAQQTLLKYLNLREKFKQVFFDLDYLDPKMNELIDSGYLVVSPNRDKYGRRIVICNLSRLDPYKFTSAEQSKLHVIAYESMIDDEENQILGATYIGDGSNVHPAHVGMWSVTEFATLLKWGEQSFPLRHKSLHIANFPAALKYVLEFALTRVSQKLKDRVKIYSGMTGLHEEVDPSCLPKEFGGTMEMSKMIELWKKELKGKRERLLSLDSMKLLSDKGIIRRRDKIDESDIIGLQGSFRKLEVD